jgi:peptidyl-prolyl cis-trans isomerase A (cyclophilin A)
VRARSLLVGLALFAGAPAFADEARVNPAGVAQMQLARAGKPLWATLQTSLGNIVVQLDSSAAPASVAAFVGFATGGAAWKEKGAMTTRPLYDGTIFHRVIPNFLVQAGDPTGTGTGGPGFTIADESQTAAQKALHFTRGTVGLAHVPDPNASGSQFFLLVGDAPWLDGRFTQIGHLVSGLEIADRISNAPRGPGDRPLEPIAIQSIRISDKPPAMKPPKKHK